MLLPKVLLQVAVILFNMILKHKLLLTLANLLKMEPYLAIYSLNVGTDGALYGGSFGGEGDVMTFRYDYKSFYVDAAPLIIHPVM